MSSKDTRVNAKAETPKKRRWAGVLSAEVRRKQAEFYETRVRHPAIDRVLEHLLPLLIPSTESNITILTGATGVGKSTFSRTLLGSLMEEFQPIEEGDSSAIPLVAVEAVANGDSRHGFKTLYQDIRDQLLEPGAEVKSPVQIENGRMVTSAQSRMTIAALRQVVASGLRRRKTRVCVVDEAAHLLRFAAESAVMDTLKGLSNGCGVHWVLVGSFDLFDMLEESGQIARRANVLCLERYRHENGEDRRAFRQVVENLQRKWPCDDVPNFAAISNELLEMSLGCVGLLKGFLLDASAMQLQNGGKWKGDFLRRAVKANGLRDVIRREIETGEAKVRDALYGSSHWNDEMLKRLERALEPIDA